MILSPAPSLLEEAIALRDLQALEDQAEQEQAFEDLECDRASDSWADRRQALAGVFD